jgi:hypothetical protein
MKEKMNWIRGASAGAFLFRIVFYMLLSVVGVFLIRVLPGLTGWVVAVIGVVGATANTIAMPVKRHNED